MLDEGHGVDRDASGTYPRHPLHPLPKSAPVQFVQIREGQRQCRLLLLSRLLRVFRVARRLPTFTRSLGPVRGRLRLGFRRRCGGRLQRGRWPGPDF